MVLTPAKPGFAIVSCIKSKPGLSDISKTALASAFLPSLVRTVTPAEVRGWAISLYLCADDTDMFYVSRAAELRNLSATLAPWLNLQLLFYPAVKNRVPNREAALQAYTDGAEYLHRTNDDIAFLTQAWLTTAVTALRDLSPPNIGVVGPKVYGDGIRGGSTTLDVVHRTHLGIFADYYPPQLDNWYVDDWIAFAYTRGRQRRTFVLHGHNRFPRLDWTVQHVFTHGRRYKVSLAQKGLLPALIECGRDAVDGWINHTARVATACAAGGPPPAWPRVSCRAVATMPVGSGGSSAGSSSSSSSSTGGSAEGRGGKGSGRMLGKIPGKMPVRHGRQQSLKEVLTPERCERRRESVMPLEKNGFYEQAQGWCATQYEYERGPCPKPNSANADGG